jgi:hypothetical protein
MVLSRTSSGLLNLRPVLAVHTGVGGFPATLAATGTGGGRKFTQAALTPPRSRARLNPL